MLTVQVLNLKAGEFVKFIRSRLFRKMYLFLKLTYVVQYEVTSQEPYCFKRPTELTLPVIQKEGLIPNVRFRETRCIRGVRKDISLNIWRVFAHYLTNKEAWAVYYTVIKHDRHLRTRGKCRKHEPQASVFYISRVFSNDWSVLSQCNTRLRFLH